MKAILPAVPSTNASQLDKEVIKRHHVIGLINGEMREIIDCRLYMSRSGDGASPVYCAMWVHGAGFYASGKGTARGYGYHKGSAAVQWAIDSAGIKLDKDIDGRGWGAVEEAFSAIGEALGASKVIVVG